MPMTQLSCFKATMAHQRHEGYLFYAEFTSSLRTQIREKFGLDEEVNIQEYFGMFRPQIVVPKPPENMMQPDFNKYYQDIEMPPNAKIDSLGVLHVPGSMYHFTHFISPLRNAASISDLESFIYPNTNGYTEDHMAEEVKSAHKQGRTAACWVGHMYEDSWQIRGYEEFLMDMLTQPEWCEYILDRVTARNKQVAIAGAKAGVDFLRTGDDVANQRALMFSIEHWRRFMKPRWAEVYAAAKAIKPDIQIWYHSDGDISSIIPELIEIGVTILNPIQPECMDLEAIKKNYGSKLVFDGSIGTQTTMPFGTPADVRNVVKERAKTLGADGALIFSPTHILEPEVPIENIIAFVETVKEFGKIQ